MQSISFASKIKQKAFASLRFFNQKFEVKIKFGSSEKILRDRKWCSGAWCKMALESIPMKSNNPWQNQAICQIIFENFSQG